MMQNAIQIDDLSFRHADSDARAIDQMSLNIAAGE